MHLETSNIYHLKLLQMGYTDKNLQHLCSVKLTMVKVNQFLICPHNCQDNIYKTDTPSERRPFHNHYNHYYSKMKTSFSCTFVSLTSYIFYRTTATMSQTRHKSHLAFLKFRIYSLQMATYHELSNCYAKQEVSKCLVILH